MAKLVDLRYCTRYSTATVLSSPVSTEYTVETDECWTNVACAAHHTAHWRANSTDSDFKHQGEENDARRSRGGDAGSGSPIYKMQHPLPHGITQK